MQEQRALKEYQQEGISIKILWASNVFKKDDIELVPASHRHRVVRGQRGNQDYIFHLMFIVLDELATAFQLGIAGDVCVHPTGISWHDGAGWKKWQHSSPTTSIPQHPFLPGERRLAFKLTHICLVWSPEVTIRTFRAQFNQYTAVHIPELQQHRQAIMDDARVQEILAVEYVNLNISDLAYLVTFLLRLYSHVLPSAAAILQPTVISAQPSMV